MAFEKKAWTDRVAEFINRRVLTKEDGTTEIVTVARSEGNVTQEGDAFNSENMNNLEQRIAYEFALQGAIVEKALIIESFDASTGELVTKSSDYTA